MPHKAHLHLAQSVIMVHPIDFQFNEQTGTDNEFQNRPMNTTKNELNLTAMKEFHACVKTLNNLGIETLLLGKSHTNKQLPDALFPNNWFSTRSDGKLIIYPMKAQNRRDEVQAEPLTELLTNSGYQIDKFIDLRKILPKNSLTNQAEVLEGTGAIVFHHPSNQLFAAISDRCEENALNFYSVKFNYKLVGFNTSSANGFPIYHTNVLMSCGENFAVVTPQVITKPNRKIMLQRISESIDDIIVITEVQMRENFCGNILQLKSKLEQPVIAMSESAYAGFTRSQKVLLENHGSLAVCKIPTIERIGGGSIRCMLAENFLQKKTVQPIPKTI